MKTLLIALTLFTSTLTFAETSVEERPVVNELPRLTVESQMPEILVIGVNLQTNIQEQREELKRQISLTQEEMIKIFKKELEIDRSSFDVEFFETQSL